ncbi:phosphate:acyl-(acyl carrier protein) acyltransferase [Schinkia azotoformans MEV2011]|uniref:Phosphate acyltransferase n=1 Tax=Schinkia azotoformans MEV2011 TaxID=1348973 RepID=A0A072NQ80_SCHAZ|nr:phosphate acyltransferase PlsX [Schinkia azotoformans]KEF39844.1 phosphate:acyl-(acyl carrier protein) acyltransferase [Schinkia azotoformans MEV2011]MEC1697142.1 phosphate acyltransferase PlsX [Schinkia azotoformans]MEC1715325.1 phosphate acyltransferase PlsX [Schinkia azotoformans]MEC1724181.1 phosphate acyltransferase PlsX [Schinkia azotoformans]MEC1740924.1 phosphate acyltransferase PlsX [Schinkia azotoformans]
MRIAIDAMGGDHAPEQIIKGVNEAVTAFPSLEFALVGNEEKIKKYLVSSEKVSIIHTDEVIEATDEPVRAVRRKKTASMVLMANEVKEGRADACISAGNTGALMAAGLFVVGRIEGIDRPALSPTLPTIDGQGFVFLDVGANADARPEHLLQFAIMGSVYAEKVRKINNPRVGLLNVGTEEKKGNDLTKHAFPLLQDAPINFVGNVEARDLLEGVADVVVTDGFSGNIALKSIEGTALAIFSMLKTELTSSLKTKLATGVIKPQLRNLKNKLDYSEYGGAGLFGLKAPVIKAHGSSDQTAILNAIRQAKDMVEKQVIQTIETTIQSK